MKNKQAGFTLVEIAIVLVIIGLLLGGVLKGQELINSARVKNMVADFRTVPALVYGYQDRFRRFPGDQDKTQLDTAFGTGTATVCTPAADGHCTVNNGRLDGDWNATAVTDETYVFWQHVRLANLATGSVNTADANYAPVNADGGRIGIESGIDSAGTPKPFIKDMRGAFFVCSDLVYGRFVRQIDITMDNGDTASGSVQAVAVGSARGAAAVATNAIVDGQQYIVCAGY
jgi:prepilin-type N-terminal cleavage/methylation domain-containing protein